MLQVRFQYLRVAEPSLLRYLLLVDFEESKTLSAQYPKELNAFGDYLRKAGLTSDCFRGMLPSVSHWTMVPLLSISISSPLARRHVSQTEKAPSLTERRS